MNHEVVGKNIRKTTSLKNRLCLWLFQFRGILKSPPVAFILFFIIMVGLFSLVTAQEGDDLSLGAAHLQYSLPGFLADRYYTWSGRFLNETLCYYFNGQAQYFWKWLCAVSITTSAVLIYRFVTYGRKLDEMEKVLFAYLSCFSVMLINSSVLSSSVFWMTGALNYLVPFSMSLIAFVPFFDALQNADYQPSKLTFLFLAPAVLTVIGVEQSSLCFTTFSLLVLIFLVIKKRKVPAVLVTIFIFSVIFQIFSLTVPGNAVRYAEGITTWFPAFHQISTFDRLAVSLHFLFNTIINQWFLLLLLLWLATAVLLTRTKSTWLSRLVAYLCFSFAFLVGLRFILNLDPGVSKNFGLLYNKLFEFRFVTKQFLFAPKFFIPYAVWGLAILIIPIAIFLIFDKTKYSFFYTSIYLAALASIFLMVLSPTLYASAGRTSFPPNMLLILLFLLLLRHNGLVRDFAVPILIIVALKIIMIYSNWLIDGYQLDYGVLNTQGIPFAVLGDRVPVTP